MVPASPQVRTRHKEAAVRVEGEHAAARANLTGHDTGMKILPAGELHMGLALKPCISKQQAIQQTRVWVWLFVVLV